MKLIIHVVRWPKTLNPSVYMCFGFHQTVTDLDLLIIRIFRTKYSVVSLNVANSISSYIDMSG